MHALVSMHSTACHVIAYDADVAARCRATVAVRGSPSSLTAHTAQHTPRLAAILQRG